MNILFEICRRINTNIIELPMTCRIIIAKKILSDSKDNVMSSIEDVKKKLKEKSVIDDIFKEAIVFFKTKKIKPSMLLAVADTAAEPSMRLKPLRSTPEKENLKQKKTVDVKTMCAVVSVVRETKP